MKILLIYNTYYYLCFLILSISTSISNNHPYLLRKFSSIKEETEHEEANNFDLDSYSTYYSQGDAHHTVNAKRIATDEYTNYYYDDYEQEEEEDAETAETAGELDEDQLSDYTLYFHEYEFDWDNEQDWQQDEEYAAANLPHACTHQLEVLEHKLCIIGKSKQEAAKDIKDPHHEVEGSPVTEKNGAFVINFKKDHGKEAFHMKHMNAEEMHHLFNNKPHPHILTRLELDDAIKKGKLSQFGNTFSVTYHGMVFDFTKDKDWKKVNAHHSPRYMDNHHIRPKIVQNNDPAPQIQDMLDDQWQELDHYNNFVKEASYSRKRYKGPKLVIPPGTQNAAWPSDPHHALNLYIPNKRPRGAPRIKDLPGNWNKLWGRSPEADYLDYGVPWPPKSNTLTDHHMKGTQDFRYHPARVKSEFGEAEDAPNVVQQTAPNTQSSGNSNVGTDKKGNVHMKGDNMYAFGNVPTHKDKNGNVYVRPGMTNMNDNVNADGKLDADALKKKNGYKEHNVQDTPHPFQGGSNPLMMNMMFTNPTMRSLLPLMMNNGHGMGVHHLLNNPYMNMMNTYSMMSNPYFVNALPYATMGYTPNLFGHGMPIYHGTRYENNPIKGAQNKMAHQELQNMLYEGEDAPTGVNAGGYHGGYYQNGGKHPLHAPWRVKMRRCRLKNGQRVIFPASQVNMNKFQEICNFDPDAPKADYSIDINVPPGTAAPPAPRFNVYGGGAAMHPFQYGAQSPMMMPSTSMMMGNPMMSLMSMNPMSMMGMHGMGMGSAMPMNMAYGTGMGLPANVHHHYPAGMNQHFGGPGKPNINIYTGGSHAPPHTMPPTTTTTTTTAAPASAPGAKSASHAQSATASVMNTGYNPYASMMGGAYNPYGMMNGYGYGSGYGGYGGYGYNPYGMNNMMGSAYGSYGYNPYGMNNMMGYGYGSPYGGYGTFNAAAYGATNPYIQHMYGSSSTPQSEDLEHSTSAHSIQSDFNNLYYDQYDEDYDYDHDDMPGYSSYTDENGEKHIHIYHRNPIPPLPPMNSMGAFTMPPPFPMMPPPLPPPYPPPEAPAKFRPPPPPLPPLPEPPRPQIQLPPKRTSQPQRPPIIIQAPPQIRQPPISQLGQPQTPFGSPQSQLPMGPSRIIAVPAPPGPGSGSRPSSSRGGDKSVRRRYRQRLKRIKRRHRREIKRLKRELRRRRKGRRRSRIVYKYRCDRCSTHRCHPTCGKPSCTSCRRGSRCHSSCHQQPLMYAVQSYGFQMAGNPPMPYGVAYAYPVTYTDMKVPVVHGAMIHPSTGMIHPYTAMPHPAMFGPQGMGMGFGQMAKSGNLNKEPPILGPINQPATGKASAASTSPQNVAGKYGTGIHDPMMGGTMVPPVNGNGFLMNAMNPEGMNLGAPMLPMYPRYQVAYPLYHVIQRIHRIPMNGMMGGMGMNPAMGGMGGMGMMQHPMGGMGMGMNPMMGGMGMQQHPGMMGGMGMMQHPADPMGGMGMMQHPMGMGMGMGMHPGMMGGMGMQQHPAMMGAMGMMQHPADPTMGMGMNPMMGGMGMGSGMGMNPMMNPMSQQGVPPHFNGQNSMLPATGEVTKCQPLAHMELCATFNSNNNKLKINVKVAKTKRKKEAKKKPSKSDRYKLKRKSSSKAKHDLFPRYKNPFKHKKPPKGTRRRSARKKKPAPKAAAKAAKPHKARQALLNAYYYDADYAEYGSEYSLDEIGDTEQRVGEFYMDFKVMESEDDIMDELDDWLEENLYGDYDEYQQDYYATNNAMQDYDDFYGYDDEYTYDDFDAYNDEYGGLYDDEYEYAENDYYNDEDDYEENGELQYDENGYFNDEAIDFEFDDETFDDHYFANVLGGKETANLQVEAKQDYQDELENNEENAEENADFTVDELNEFEEYLDYAEYLDDTYSDSMQQFTLIDDMFFDELENMDEDYMTNTYDSLMDLSEWEANTMNWRNLDDMAQWIQAFESGSGDQLSSNILSKEVQHVDDALFLDYGSFINYDDEYDFDWHQDDQWRYVYNDHEDKSMVNSMGVRDGKKCSAIIPFLQSKLCLTMNDAKLNLHLRAASKEELNDMMGANYFNQFDTYSAYDDMDDDENANSNDNTHQKRKLLSLNNKGYDDYYAFSIDDVDKNEHYIDDDDYDEAKWMEDNNVDYTQAYLYDFVDDEADKHVQAEDEISYDIKQSDYESLQDQQLQLANYYSSLNSFDYNAGQGFFDDAGNFYDRDAMRELLNFHFQDGLDLNDDDHWDEVTITTSQQQSPSNSAAATDNDDDDNGYYDELYFEEMEGFSGKGKYYKKQARVSTRKMDGVNDAPFLASVQKMVKQMKSGTLAFETSLQRGLPVHIPNVYEKIKKCVSADPLFKLCFVVNPRKKSVTVKVRVPGFKKAINDALRDADLTRFQQRMFGSKVGNALHDIAKRIKIPSVDDIFGEMNKSDKRKKRRADEEAGDLKKLQQRLTRYLNPKQRARFKKLTMSKLFSVRCGTGRKGRLCRRKKARLLRKIAGKVAGRRRRSRRRRRGRRSRRRRRRKEKPKVVCKKCLRHLQKFKIFNDRYRNWYKQYYKTWYQRHVSGPYYRRVLDHRQSERERMRAKVRNYKRMKAFRKLKLGDKSAVGRAIQKMRKKLKQQTGSGGAHVNGAKFGTQSNRQKRVDAVKQKGSRVQPKGKSSGGGGGASAAPKGTGSATPGKEAKKANGKAAGLVEDGDYYDEYQYYDGESDGEQEFVTDKNELMALLEQMHDEEKADEAAMDEYYQDAIEGYGYAYDEDEDNENEYDYDRMENEWDLGNEYTQKDETFDDGEMESEYGFDEYYESAQQNNDQDDGYYFGDDSSYDNEDGEEEASEEAEEDEDQSVYGFGHRILISSTSFWILQICSILFGGLIVMCTMCFFSALKYMQMVQDAEQKMAKNVNMFNVLFMNTGKDENASLKRDYVDDDNQEDDDESDTSSSSSFSSQSAEEFDGNEQVPGHVSNPELISDVNSVDPLTN